MSESVQIGSILIETEQKRSILSLNDSELINLATMRYMTRFQKPPRRKIQPYVLVETADALEEAAYAQGLSLGQYIDRLFMNTPAAPSITVPTLQFSGKQTDPELVAQAVVTKMQAHVPVLQGKNGTVCRRCGISKAANPQWARPCPGVDPGAA